MDNILFFIAILIFLLLINMSNKRRSPCQGGTLSPALMSVMGGEKKLDRPPRGSIWNRITLPPSEHGPRSILEIGAGNLSFSLSLADLRGTAVGMFVTDLEPSWEIEEDKSNLFELLKKGATINLSMDVRKTIQHLDLNKRKHSIGVIIWQYPHGEVKNKSPECLTVHQKLFKSFFEGCKELLRPGGYALITVIKGFHYDKWNLPEIAEGIEEIYYQDREPFSPGWFKRYSHVTTNKGADMPVIEPAYTYIFRKRDFRRERQKEAQSVESEKLETKKII